MKSVTAIIPTYNHAAVLPRAIESVLEQSRPVDEIIVLDDGSTDNTSDVVKNYLPRIRYVRQENRGLSAARNAAITLATSDWIAPLDADDYWLPRKIEKQLEVVSASPNVTLVYNSVYLEHPGGERLLMAATPIGQLWPSLRFRNCITGSGSSVLMRRDEAIAAGLFDETLTACEDWDLWIRMAIAHQFGCVDEPLAVISESPGSMSKHPHRMLRNTQRIMDRSLLLGLRGVRRLLWRRRVWAAALYSAALAARSGTEESAKQFLWQSLVQWPSPTFLPGRWAAFGSEMLRTGERRAPGL
jgi:glycosyltransferase involved in cell wall biosynthesis